MKVTNNMIAPDLRFLGRVYKLLLGWVPRMKISAAKKTRRRNEVRTVGKPYNRYIKRSDGTDLRLYIMEPKAATQKVPGVLWIHGGGFAIGMPEMALASMAKPISQECVVVSPDYRLSVEKPFPAALDDCYQSLLWMKEHADELGIRSDQLFVGGESAGGGLTVALCLYARDKGEVKVAFQMPLYPMLDDRRETESMKDNDAPVWSERQNKRAWSLYLRGQEEVSKYAAPARESDYRGMPPALSYVGSIEPFRDETLSYVQQLKRAGIVVDFTLYEGCYHAFDVLVPWSKEAKAAKAFFVDRFAHACKTYFSPQDS